MCLKADNKHKLAKIEEMVQQDVSNGRHVQKRIRARLLNKGFSPEKIIEELKQSKIGV